MDSSARCDNLVADDHRTARAFREAVTLGRKNLRLGQNIRIARDPERFASALDRRKSLVYNDLSTVQVCPDAELFGPIAG
jgi:hypothetical protein